MLVITQSPSVKIGSLLSSVKMDSPHFWIMDKRYCDGFVIKCFFGICKAKASIEGKKPPSIIVIVLFGVI